MTLHFFLNIPSSAPSWRRLFFVIGLFVFLTFVASLIRLSRADFNLFPILEPLDCGGTSPNFFVAFANPLFLFFLNKKVEFVEYIKLSLALPIAMAIYEYAQIYMSARTFDYYDILASFIGGVCSIIMSLVIFFKFQKSNS